ncbi:MAG TPA: hypothetical protein VM779_05395 [Thermoanaerobaculia bacterium]|nr:hypothetical protein [Thermoanaerobaculia bacterium]
MRKHRISRRDFVTVTAIATAGLLVARPAPARGGSRRPDALADTLRNVLDFHVQGAEKSNDIAGRLGTVLAHVGGRPRGLAEARRQILFRAAADVEQARRRLRDVGRRSVTENLNEFLDAVRVVPSSSRLLDPLIGGMAVAVLFATHGVHFPDTRFTQQRLRRANRELKNRESAMPLSSRFRAKKAWLHAYRKAIAQRRLTVSFGGHFPEGVTIRSVWLSQR